MYISIHVLHQHTCSPRYGYSSMPSYRPYLFHVLYSPLNYVSSHMRLCSALNLRLSPPHEQRTGVTSSASATTAQWGKTIVTGDWSLNPSGRHSTPKVTNVSSAFNCTFFGISVMTEIMIACPCGRAFAGTTTWIPTISKSICPPGCSTSITRDMTPAVIKE